MWMVFWRSGPLQLSKLFSCFFLGLVMGVVYYRISESDEAGLQSKVSSLFSIVIFAPMVLGTCAVPPMFAMREAFYRETASNTYKPWLHAVASILVEFPFIVAGSVLMTLPSYFMIDFRTDSAGVFFHFVLVMVVVGLVLVNLTQFYCAIAPMSSVAIMLSDLTITLLILFTGLLIRNGDIPIGECKQQTTTTTTTATPRSCSTQFSNVGLSQ
jgi:ABC-type multidrug transport system permease subunit